MRKGMLAIAAMLLAIAPAAPAAIRGGFVVGPGFYGPAYGWGPYWGSYWGPRWAGPYYAYPNSGEVKLDTKVKDAQVFINGAYAGTTHENKTMRLRPGNYSVEIRENGQTPFAEQVYVTAGRTVHLHPNL